ncbi:MAG: triose-phosphate isomerase, partial [Lachnospiraceae bacterium]|nr:triose-phosphate isomerase [Lachnospiraceae bacterium]
MARRKIAAGNWKMNMTPSEAKALCADLKPLVADSKSEVIYCVPAIDITTVAECIKGTNVKLGAQNMYIEDKGAFTGETSPKMLKECGVDYIIIGHSERREIFKECDCLINAKVKKAIETGITPILCCGETLEQREKGVTLDHIRLQIKSDLFEVSKDDVKNLV